MGGRRLTEPLGTAIADLEPLALEIHPAIHPGGGGVLPVLPAYVERGHDHRLREIVDRAAAGGSALVPRPLRSLHGDFTPGTAQAAPGVAHPTCVGTSLLVCILVGALPTRDQKSE